MTQQMKMQLLSARRWMLPLCFLMMASHVETRGQASTMEQRLVAEAATDLAADAREKGDPSRGAFLFHSPGLGCIKCHRSGSGESLFGPDLSSWKRTVDDRHLVDSVLRPSLSVEPEYRGSIILTIDGQSVAGIEKSRNRQFVALQTGFGSSDLRQIALDEIEAEKSSDVSLMPTGQVNALKRRQEFLDLVAYLIAIRDGGPEVARQLQPSDEALRLRLPDYESNIDHRGLIEDWDEQAFDRGEEIYSRLCINCHGTIDRPGSLPTSLRFATGKFKFGSDPFSMYQTLTHGGGLMVPQTWMVPRQKYDVIHYLREHFLRESNPSQLTRITEAYLTSLPKGDSRGPEPRVIEPWVTMDYGPMLTTTIEFGDDSNIAQKAIAIRLDEGPGGITRGDAWLAFEHDTLRMAAAWTDSFVDWQGIQFNGRHGVHLSANGLIHAANPTGPGWANPSTGSFSDDERLVGRDGRRYGPLPSSWAKFRGLHRYEDQVILRYTVGQTEILERPWLVQSGRVPVFARTLEVGRREVPLDMSVMVLDEDATLSQRNGLDQVSHSEGTITIGTPGLEDSTELRIEQGRVVLRFLRGTESVQGTVWFCTDEADRELQRSISDALRRMESNLESLTHGGPPQFATPVEVPSTNWFESDAWCVDELTRPVGNPWLARTRITGLDFYPGGNALAACTWDGDVWRVDGLETLGKIDSVLRWRRIATGLFQPLGILVEDDRIMVTCRDQLVALGDANQDGEMDDYRCFNSDHQVTEHFHEFAMGLQRDIDGKYYYAKSARHALKAVVPHHGTLLRVSPDGESTEIIANGFRAANGVCLNNDGSFIVTDQEGHWNPKNRINWVRPGGFYGNMYGYHDVTDASDDAMEQPLCWITNEFDRSPAELLWADTDRWGLLGGSLLNLSYGYGRIYVVPHEHVSMPSGERQPQGGMCQLPIPDLPTGMIRARFSPLDGQLYVGGMFSWAGSRQEQEGGLFRVRHKGNRVDLPIKMRARSGGIDITFTDPLDRKATSDIERYSIQTWDLKRTKNYGSEHYNQHALEITSSELAGDGRTIRLSVADLQPTWGMEIVCRLKQRDGREIKRVIHNSIHQLSD